MVLPARPVLDGGGPMVLPARPAVRPPPQPKIRESAKPGIVRDKSTPVVAATTPPIRFNPGKSTPVLLKNKAVAKNSSLFSKGGAVKAPKAKKK